TVGQRRGLGTGGGDRRYALSVDPSTATVVAGTVADLHTDRVDLTDLRWVGGEPWPAGDVEVQTSAHGPALAATFDGRTVLFAEPQRRVAPGQSVVLYDGDRVVGGGIAC
ncbi:MAG: tRNA-uridine 2-sulfurtransferase, partial [Actinomycetota bacterium]|nr:tRNA-uridine 2-sulfurtransferase [Actinomycetota bacterium]